MWYEAKLALKLRAKTLGRRDWRRKHQVSPSPSVEPAHARPLAGAAGRRIRLVAAIAATVILLDAGTKALATHFLTEHEPIDLLGGLISLDLYRNFAGPNNILPGHTVVISAISIVAAIALVVIAFRVTSTLAAVAVGLLLGGAVGNLLDRLLREPGPLRGGVVDWLRLADRTNSMNLADLALDAAIIVILVGAVLGWWHDRERQ